MQLLFQNEVLDIIWLVTALWVSLVYLIKHQMDVSLEGPINHLFWQYTMLWLKRADYRNSRLTVRLQLQSKALSMIRWVALKRAFGSQGVGAELYLELVYLVTALVPSDTACLASSPGSSRRTAVWISLDVMVDRLL